MTWLNHAGTSWPKPAPVHRAIETALRETPRQTGSFDTQHRTIARHLGVADPSRLLLTPGCTSALQVAMADMPWQQGDRLVIGGMEHHALHRPALKLAELGIELVVAPDLAAIQTALSEGGVRLVAHTAAANTTGELAPVHAIVEAAHHHGALALIDAAQLAGWVPDLVACGGDLITFAGHKGPQAPWGIGGLYVAPHAILRSPAATCEPPEDGELAACALMPGYCDVGSVDRVAMAGLAAGLDWLADPERADRLERARRLLDPLVDAALSLGATLHGPRDPDLRMPTAAITVPGWRAQHLGAALAEREVHVSAGLQCAPLAHARLGTEPWGTIRFSAGPTTTQGDIDAAIDAVRAVI